MPAALIATRELVRPILEKRMKGSNKKNNKKSNKRLSGGFIRHHSTMPVQDSLEPAIMSVDEKINSAIE